MIQNTSYSFLTGMLVVLIFGTVFPFALIASGDEKAASSSNTNPSRAQLEEQRDRLLSQMADKWSEAGRQDPIFQEAVRRANSTSFDSYAAKAGLLWVSKRAESHPDTIDKYNETLSLYTLETLMQMLEEPHGVQFVQSAIVGSSKLDKSQIADELARHLSDVSRKDLDAPSKLWEVLGTKMLQQNARLIDEIAKLPDAYSWPSAVVQAIGSEREATVRRFVYQSYNESHLPAGTHEIESQLRFVNQEIDSIQSSSTQPSQQK